MIQLGEGPGTERTRQESASVFQTHNLNGWLFASARRLIVFVGYVLYPAYEEVVRMTQHGTPLLTPPDGPFPKMTFEEFLEWAGEDTRAEWVDGEVIINMSPVTLAHQNINVFLVTLINHFVVKKQLGMVFLPQYLMRLRSRPSGREPDLIFVSKEHEDRLKPTYLDGPGDMVVEIVSEESIERDRETKRTEYQNAGVREYWLIDPLVPEAIFYRLNANNQYDIVPLGADGIYHSEALPGFWLNVSWLWQEPKPLFEALQALNLIA
jgi:Uma2 family endonuclease